MAGKLACVFFAFLLISFTAAAVEGQIETDPSIREICNKTKPIPRPMGTSLISLGVVNGKALLLTTPKYPPAARAQKINGDVNVSVVIDPRGCVAEAKVLSGHIFLRSSSLEAAKLSVFIPTKLSGTPVWVNGWITYKYRSGSMNWLELGYRNTQIETLIEYLPPGFDSVSRDLRKVRSIYGEEREIGMASIRENLKIELLRDPKSLWLFNVGSLLKAINDNGWNDEKRKLMFRQMRQLIETDPTTISPNLTRLLNELLELDEPEQIRDQVTCIAERLSELGR